MRCGLAAWLLVAACSGPPREPSSAPPAVEHSMPQNAAAEVEYVGAAACRECHIGKYASFADTGMGRSFYPLTPETVGDEFTGERSFHVESTDVHYRMFAREGRYFQRQYRIDSKGVEFAADERELVWVVGSNNHSRTYLTVDRGRLRQSPVCWYPLADRWDFCPGFRAGGAGFDREITPSCLFCHNGRMPTDDEGRFVEPFPHGIGCERCHGPGQLHVARWRGSEETPGGDADPTIANPRHLPREERIDVCFQCHLADSRATQRVVRYGRAPEEYRPGRRLTEVLMPFRMVEPTLSDFGLSSQGDRLIRSRCYIESGGRVECLTCHDPHVSVYHEALDRGIYRAKCLACHEADACSATSEARGATEPADDCVACHMRRTEADDQRFAEFTDHWIRRDIDSNEPDRRTDFTVEPYFPDELAALPEGEQAFYVARAYAMNTDARIEKWQVAEREFLRSVELGFDNAEVRFFLGEALRFQGRHRDAVDAYERALSHDPLHRDSVLALGQTLAGLGDPERAAELFRRVLDDTPQDAVLLGEFGQVLWQMQRFDEALRVYDEAVDLEPLNGRLHTNRGMVLASLQRFDEAAAAAVLATRLDPDGNDPWVLYFNAMREAGEERHAAEGRQVLDRLRDVER